MDDLPILSLLRSLLIVWLAFPRLAPWAVFLRRFAASRGASLDGQPGAAVPTQFLFPGARFRVVDSNVFIEARPMEIQRVGVVGAGTMGNGIAHVFARAGYNVVLCDVEQRFLDRALETVTKNLEREVAKNKITAEAKAGALSRIRPVTDRGQLADCDFVIEAATEKFEIKTKIFRDLDRLTRPEIILASNTSSISITKLAAQTKRPEKVIGMHFFNPVPVMKLVEVIRGLATSQDTFASVRELSMKLEKTPVEVNDAPGFVSNRVLMPLLNEAMYAVMEGVATADAVDEVFKLGMAHPMGPLTLADFIGLDVCLDIMRVLQSGMGDPKYRPCPLLIKMVDAGWLGRKSGRGFYTY
jgi:3-hydroxybutyryl-CoA dehydrogenase